LSSCFFDDCAGIGVFGFFSLASSMDFRAASRSLIFVMSPETRDGECERVCAGLRVCVYARTRVCVCKRKYVGLEMLRGWR